MAISAKFLADFSSFQDAVKKADVSLGQMDVSAKKVGTSLNKLTDEFSGEKIKREAALAEEAVLRIGGASKLTVAEQARVNATITEALAKYKALGMEAPQSLRMMAEETKRVEAATIPASKSMEGFLTHFKATLAGMVSAQAIIGAARAAFGALTDFVGSSIKSYSDAEAAQKKLTAALTASGQATPQVIGQFNKLAREFQNTTVYSDDLVTEMQALLVQVGNVMPHQMEGALTAATNLASGLGIDLRQATMLVGKAFEGETGTLKRYGIVIDEAKLKAEGMPAVLEAIQSKFGGQAQAEAESYAGKIKHLENVWGEFKEAVGKSIVEDPLVTAGLKALTDQVKGTGDAAQSTGVHVTAFVAGLVSASPHIQEAVERIGRLQKEINDVAAAAKKLRDAIPHAPGFEGEAPTTIPARPAEIAALQGPDPVKVKAAAEAVKQYAESVKKLRDSMTGVSLQGEVKRLQAAFEGLTPAQARSVTTTDNFARAAKRLYDDGAKLTPELFRIMAATQQLTPPMQTLSAEMLNSVGPGFKLLYDLSAKLPASISGISGSFGGLVYQMKLPVEATKDWSASLDDLARGFTQLSQVSKGAISRMAGDVGSLVVAWDLAAKALKAYEAAGATATQKAASILSMSVSVIGVVQMMASWLDRDDLSARMVKDVKDAHGGLQAFRAEAELAGVSVEHLFTLESAESFRRELARIEDAIAKQKDMMERYGLTWRDFGQQVRQSQVNQTVRQLVEDMKQLTKLGADPLKAMSGAFNQLIVDAVKTGTKIPAALDPILQKLIRMGKLTDEAARAMLGLEKDTMPAMADIKAAADRYGISLDRLGPKVAQLGISEEAAQIIKDFNLLILAGADVGVVMQAMQKNVQKMVIEALKLGLALPESMRPLIDQMIAAGLLTDEFGNKLTDTGRINFQVPLVEKIDELIEALKDLISHFTSMADAAVEEFGRARGAAESLGFAIPRQFPPGQAPPPPPPGTGGGDTAIPRPPEYASGTHGQYVDFGAGRNVRLHGRERIMTSGEGGGEVNITVPVTIDGREVARVAARYIPETLEGRF